MPIFIVTWFSISPLLVIYLSFKSPVASIFLPILFLFFVIFFWLKVFRTRAFQVEIDESVIIVKGCFGIGKSKIYRFNELDGFDTLFESGKLGLAEFLFILKNGKRIGGISSFYHVNYDKMKLLLQKDLVDLGERK
ncbi:hypothetical protein EOD40_06275 [Flavobacterium sufflavum]|uniref:Uncharacterized protein n=1 Tax=Flavobacterium sufflavum TaxID=1921138 RepID=A0A3S2UQ95_9FLAO|nr:hypothetical protein [Flavobacterium sufflavum]RVT77410.1 hypothetical protein EOD40_06275 [Flavobacterium sufflavum]